MKPKILILFMSLATVLSAQTNLISYEYWFNNDYANVQAVSFTPSANHQLDADFDVSALSNGVNVLNIRYKDDKGVYSSTLSKIFIKQPASGSAPNKLAAYEYWFDNDYANAVKTTVGSADFLLDGQLSTNALPAGVHVLNVRFKDSTGRYSSTLSRLFYLTKESTLPDGNKITAWRYWLNDDLDFHHVYTLVENPSQMLFVNDDLDLSLLPKGEYDIHFQFKDGRGAWSSVWSASIQKEQGPLGTAVDRNNAEESISLYPNPVKDKLHLDLNGAFLSFRLIISDVSGRTMYVSEHKNGQLLTVDLSAFPAGIYFVTLIGDSKTALVKVVKE
jgi:hypothetical protein